MFAYVYPPNEPAGVAAWVGEELAEAGEVVSILSHPSNFEEVIRACAGKRAVVFNGALTQLSWLFDTPEKVARWNLDVRIPRVGMSTEMVFCVPPQHGEFQKRAWQAMRVMTHLIGFHDCPSYEMETERLKQMGVPLLMLKSLPFAFKKFFNRVPWSQRRRKFCFVGTYHGHQRQAVMDAIRGTDLVDLLTIPKSSPELVVETYNQYCGTINPRGSHDVPLPVVPRFLEASACGCYVLDLQSLPIKDAAQCVGVIQSVDWGLAEIESVKQWEVAKLFSAAGFPNTLRNFLQAHPYAG